ncbi:MAG: cytochrome b5-like heme/steroid binding domain-containing protein, partial [Nannocystaceae bacterium]
MLSPPAPKFARTLEELAQHDGTHGSYWTAIDGEVYDISTFVKAHPGGSIIRLAAGRDATVLLESYHPTASLGRVRRALKTEATHLGPLATKVDQNADPTFYRVVRQRVDRYLKARNL